MVNFEFFDSFYDDSVTKEITVTATGINIDSSQINVESLFLEEKLNTQNDLTFGQCNPHGVEMDIFSECPNLIGVTVTVTVILSDHPEEPFVIGNYKVYEDTLDEDTDLRHIVAWDALSEINNADITEWWNALQFPLTVKNLRDSFFQQFGITQEEKTLINDSETVPQTVYGELTGFELLTDILNMNAVSGYIDRNGNFKFIDYADPDEVDISERQYQNIEIETFMTEEIDKVQIRSSGSDIGAIVGGGSNAYVIEDNLLLYGKTAAELETIATKIFDKISSIQYYPCEIEMVGNPCIECGDLLHISVNGVEKDTFVMNRDLSGIQEMIDDVQTPGQKTRSEQVYSVNKELRKMRGKSFYIEKTVEGLKLEVEDISEDYVDKATFEMSSSEVQLQIESLQSQIDGEIQYWETTETPTLLNYPYWDFCTNIPCNNTVQTTNDLKFIYTEDNRRTHLRDLCFDTENLISYRFVKENDAWGWQEIADTETNVILQRISRLEITSEGLQTDVGQISYELDNNIYTKAETDSQISQTATQIQSTVSANYATKTTTNSMQSQINQQASQISAKVSQTGGQSSTFGWELTSSAFSLKSQNDEVFRASANGLTVKGNFEMTGGKVNILTNTQTDNSLISLKRVYNNVTRWTTISEGRVSVIGANGAVTIDDGKLTATASDITAIETHDITIKNGTLQTRILPANYVDGYVIPRATQFNYGSFISATSYNLRYSAEAGGYVFASLPTFVTGYALSSAPSNGQKFVYST